MRATVVALCAVSAVGCDRPLADPAAPSRPVGSLLASDDVRLEVRFADTLRMRPAADGVRSETRQSHIEALDAAVRGRASSIRPLVTLPADRVEQLRRDARGRRAAVPDPLSWYVIATPRSESDALVARLNALSEVDTAYVAPAPAPLPAAVATADFASMQTYFGMSPDGVGVVALRGLPGGDGASITVVDVEYNWLFAHEDLTLPADTHIGGNFYYGFGDDHGTAVLGILAGRDNGFGVTGAAPAAKMLTSAPHAGGAYVPADAVLRATGATSEGDVILVEQQTWGPTGSYVPLEWVPSVYEATRMATLAGRIVVAAAGNGSANMDDAVFGGRFDRTRFNSGAIIVGAGDALRARLWFSTFGSRVDLQGRGNGVVTTGYGDLFGTDPTNSYTRSFGGTSSASAIVAGVVAAVQGYAKHELGVALSAAEMASLLRGTGAPQSGITPGAIGPLPNVVAAATRAAAYAPALVSIDIKPRQPQNVIPLRGLGGAHVAVAVLATPTFDPGTVDVSTAGLGNALAGFVPPLRDAGGVVATDRTDVNRDGDSDLTLEFSRDDLMRAGALARSSNVLMFRAGLSTGGRIRGGDMVRPVP